MDNVVNGALQADNIATINSKHFYMHVAVLLFIAMGYILYTIDFENPIPIHPSSVAAFTLTVTSSLPTHHPTSYLQSYVQLYGFLQEP